MKKLNLSEFKVVTLIICFIGLAAIVLTGYIFMTKFELLVNYLQENENDFYKFVKIISLIIFIMFTVVSFCLNFIVFYKNFILNTVCKDIKKNYYEKIEFSYFFILLLFISISAAIHFNFSLLFLSDKKYVLLIVWSLGFFSLVLYKRHKELSFFFLVFCSLFVLFLLRI